MKTIAFFLTMAFAFFNACERPPQTAEVNRNATDHSKMDHSKMGHAMESSPGAAKAPYELQFIDTMIAHHQGAVDMAQLVNTRAQHAELKTLARSIIADQQKEMAQMREWRAKLFGETAPAVNMDLPGMRDGMHGMNLAKLDLLKANEFDLEFIRQMIPHHEGAVAMANDALAKDTNAEIKTLCEAIVKAQNAEIEQMKQWLADWSK
jgi:uncharacterized protein (DUF305 family)